jgi:hypothetical protein
MASAVVVQFESRGPLFPSFQKPDDFFNRPRMIRDSGLDCWRSLQAHMSAVEVVNHHENG